VENSDHNQEVFQHYWEKIKKNEDSAWAKLNFVLQRSTYLFLKKKGLPEEDISEIYQEVISLFYEKICASANANNETRIEFKSFSKLKSYIISIADKKRKEYYRRKKKNRNIIDIEKLPKKAFSQNPRLFTEDEKEKQELISMVKDCVNQLPKNDQKILFFAIHGYNSKQTGEELGVTAGTARARKRRAFIKLKALVQNSRKKS
jgi:RNA polymerase sigma factor (sigma-70 family)